MYIVDKCTIATFKQTLLRVERISSRQHPQGNSNSTASRAVNLVYLAVCVHLHQPTMVAMEMTGGVRRLGPASSTCRDSANSYANAKAPAACRHCSPTGVPVSPGLTYYANFRKTLTEVPV